MWNCLCTAPVFNFHLDLQYALPVRVFIIIIIIIIFICNVLFFLFDFRSLVKDTCVAGPKAFVNFPVVPRSQELWEVTIGPVKNRACGSCLKVTGPALCSICVCVCAHLCLLCICMCTGVAERACIFCMREFMYTRARLYGSYWALGRPFLFKTHFSSAVF